MVGGVPTTHAHAVLRALPAHLAHHIPLYTRVCYAARTRTRTRARVRALLAHRTAWVCAARLFALYHSAALHCWLRYTHLHTVYCACTFAAAFVAHTHARAHALHARTRTHWVLTLPHLSFLYATFTFCHARTCHGLPHGPHTHTHVAQFPHRPHPHPTSPTCALPPHTQRVRGGPGPYTHTCWFPMTHTHVCLQHTATI